MINIQLDEGKIEAAIKEQIGSITERVIGSTPIDPRYIFHTVDDVAKRLQCSHETVRVYIKAGKKDLTGKRTVKLKSTEVISSEYRITEADLREFVDSINLMPTPKA